MTEHRTRQIIVFVLSLLVACPGLPTLVLAQSGNNPPPVDRLDALVTEGEYQQAYELANSELFEWEGDPEFDLLYGLAALESGNPNEAVFALERVSNSAPQRTQRLRARLELARAHFATGNLDASENLFRNVLESDPPQNVRDNITVFLGLIDNQRRQQRSSTDFEIAANGGHDNNVNSATANALIDTPLIGQVELNPDGRKTADEFMEWNGSLRHRRPLRRNLAVEVDATLNSRDNLSTDDFDLDTLRSGVSAVYTQANHRLRGGLNVQRAWLKGDGFQTSAGLTGSWQRSGGGSWYQTASLSLNAIRYDNAPDSPRNDLRDVNQALISGGLIRVSAPWTHSLNVFYANESALREAGRHNGRRFHGAAYSGIWDFSDQHQPYARVSLQEVRHKGRHPVFFEHTREDTQLSATAGWRWQYNGQLEVNGELMYMDADSNITLFDYSRFRFQAGVRYRFER
ncbi:MAG: porin family protein [Pseudohongiellaceae bacterium]